MPQAVLGERYASVRMELDLLDSTERARGFLSIISTGPSSIGFEEHGSVSAVMFDAV